MFPRSLRLVRLAGVDVRLDPSLVVFAVLIVWTFTGRFQLTFGLATGIGMALIGTVAFLASVLAHELAHALEARHRGMHVEGITLFLFGGVTEMHAHGQTARDELAVAAVGPYVSLLCAAVFGLVATFVPAAGPVGAPVAAVAGLLGWLNLALAVFNLVPGAPLDGGRVLRALLWLGLGDRMTALRVSVRAGQLLALVLVVAAAWLFARVPGAGFSALLTAVIGAFLFHAARKELAHAELDELLTEHTVASLLPRGLVLAPDGAAPEAATPAPIDVTADLHELIDRFQGDHEQLWVVAPNGQRLGLIAQQDAARAIAALRADARGRGVRAGRSARPERTATRP